MTTGSIKEDKFLSENRLSRHLFVSSQHFDLSLMVNTEIIGASNLDLLIGLNQTLSADEDPVIWSKC